jgi:hypothetical protein
MAGGDAMKDLRDDIVDYLDLRRSLGFRLKKDERLLLDFAAFMERRGAARITSKLALAWAQQPVSTDSNYLAGRLRAVRSFARYRIVTDPRTEIPPDRSAAAATQHFPASYLPPGGDRPPSRRQFATTTGSQADLALVALCDLRPAERHRDARQRSTEP